MDNIIAIILAAGEGKRMKSKNSKVVHKICGKSLIEHVVEEVQKVGIEKQIVVVGHRADQVKNVLGEKVDYVVQEEQNGTGHAVMQAISYIENLNGKVLVLCGDTPLIKAETLQNTILEHQSKNNLATIITTKVADPCGYGRIVRSQNGEVLKIVECRDASTIEKNIKEINSGMYLFDSNILSKALKNLKNENSQGEFYLTDTIEILINSQNKVGAYITEDTNEIFGINDRIQLSNASEIMQYRIIENLMKSGVTFIDPKSTYINKDVKIGMDTIIHPSTIILGNTIIGEDCEIGPDTKIENSQIANNVVVNSSYILSSSVDDFTKIGPFAYLRPGSKIGKNVKVGDFVEVKKAKIGDNTKISHLSYVGDAEIGKNVNIGCGVVVVNYDGKNKHTTIVKDGAFVGCNVNLISPVEVEENAYIAAGSTITNTVPKNSLAIARERQTILKDWVIKKNLKENK